ncbi:MAG: tripartite tricarboxylate transporter substrate binding protein [Betaproteobacteria bacterium]|nr:MAG: tripartite tricarboxylate transporter substrate binding protein [Betaproteobacteria bacterium]
MTTSTIRRAGLLAALPLCAALSAIAADSYPTKPVRFIVPYPPGGTTDLVARGIGAKLTERYSQQFVVDNRGGASTMIGTDLMAKSAPDGYTIELVTQTTMSINPNVVTKPPYDTERDLAPITQVVYFPYVIAAHPSAPFSTLKEMIAYAKSRPGSVTYGTPGTASTNHLGGALLETLTGIKLLHVPFKGSGPAMTAVLGGQVQTIITGAATVIPQAKAGKVKVIAFAAEKRHPNWPDIPSTGEAGLKGYEAGTWFGIVTRAGVARPIINNLNKEIIAALGTAELGKSLTAVGFDIRTQSPEEFAKYIKADRALLGKVIKAANITLN